jgi:predicted phage-related endonuclease
MNSEAVTCGEAGAASAKPTTELPRDAENWIALIADCEAKIRDLEEAKKLARGHLERMLGSHEIGTLAGQPVVRWTFVQSRRLDQRKLKEQAPDLVAECTVDAVSRRFTLVSEDDR